jgi:hypothetical protein
MILQTRLRDNILKIYLPLQQAKVSKSGKNLTIGSSFGPAGTGVEYEGQPVLVVVNAFVRNPEHPVRSAPKPSTKNSKSKTPNPK